MSIISKIVVKVKDLRAMIKGCYDVQKLRIAMGNRIVDNFKVKLGIKTLPKDDEKQAKEDKKILKKVLEDYNLITDGVAKITCDIKLGGGIISEWAEIILVRNYVDLLKHEKELFSRIDETILGNFPIWTEFMKDVKGCGPAMASLIISYVKIEKARHASSLRLYMGLNPDSIDGRAVSRHAEHLIDRPYIDKDGNTKMKKSIKYNNFLKSKMIMVLGPSFLRSKSPYAKYYYDAKNRYENHVKYGKDAQLKAQAELDVAKKLGWDKEDPKFKEIKKRVNDASPIHRHKMANRIMLQIFALDLWLKWRELEHLPISKPYHEEKLGLIHGDAPAHNDPYRDAILGHRYGEDNKPYVPPISP